MFQLFKNISIEFLGYIFLELFVFESGKLFWDTPVFVIMPKNLHGFSLVLVF